MKFDCEIKVKHNFKNINTIVQKLPQVKDKILEDILNNIRGYAIRLEKGHKEEGIIVDMVDMSTKESKGRVYADPSKFMTENGQSYLFFEYFGTRTVCRNGSYRKNEAFFRKWIYRMVHSST